MSNDYQMSRKQRRRLRHNSIYQTRRIFHGVQGEASRRMQDHLQDARSLIAEARREVKNEG